MKVPLRWLQDFVDIELSPNALAHRLTMAGLEAESIVRLGADWDNVYVGTVTGVSQHPDADRLVLAAVRAGPHALTVVTGAPNIAEGQKVALALAGARLWDAYSEAPKLKTLKPGTIRGVRSEGMVCSEKELGLSDEHEGILVLDAEAPDGATLQEWLGDTVIDFEITPNLVHAFSIMGIGREVAALTAKPLRSLDTAALGHLPKTDGLVAIEAPDLCPRYLGVVIHGMTVGPSPAWLVRRLRAAGIRSINNVVDVTNYVMLETGQPLHAFDLDCLAGERIVVRGAAPGEKMETLDHQERQLTPEMLLICDAEKPVAIAGVMGGLHSEVSDHTTRLLLESATFDMRSVRHTSRALKLRTDASARFERGIDPELASLAAARATSLLLEICPDARALSYQDVYPTPAEERSVSFPYSRIERVLGMHVDASTAADVLRRLGFASELSGSVPDQRLTVKIPSHRTDVTLPEDVIEEVARMVGYEHLPETLPAGRTPPVTRDELAALQDGIRAGLAASGCFEVVTYVTLSEADLVPFARETEPEHKCAGFLHAPPRADLLRVVNPLQSGVDMLRPTLLPSLLTVAAENRKHAESVRIFEVARVYLPTARNELPNERATATLVLTGKRQGLSRFAGDEQIDYWDLKGALDALFRRLSLDPLFAAESSIPVLHPGRAATIAVGKTIVGLAGELRPDVARTLGFGDDTVAVAEIDVQALHEISRREAIKVSTPRFLPVEQDFAVIVDKSVAAAKVLDALQAGAGPLATSVTLFDLFEGAQIGEDKKSLAYRISFTAPDRALTDAELTKTRGRIEKVLKQRVNGTLRT